MPVHCQTIINLLEAYAPKYMAEDWDSIGLQIGDPSREIRKVFLTLDLDEEVLDEAVSLGAEMLVVHHTPLFKPLKNLRTDLPVGRLISKIVQQGLVLYTAHTNLDAADGGINDLLAQRLGLHEVRPLSVSWNQKLYKLAVYVPPEYTEIVSEAMCKAGAGWIGNYSDCTFRLEGTGTFRPLEGSNPFLGQENRLERVAEDRLETIVPEQYLSRVIKTMLKAHPYEEVAYDIYLLQNEGKKAGLGRVGRMSQALSLREFIQHVKDVLGVKGLRYCGRDEQKVEKVALCGGSGASLLQKAIFSGAQVFLTADVKYHEAQEALAHGLAIVDAGHFATENLVVPVLAEYLRRELKGQDIEILISQLNTDPFQYACT